MSGTTTTPAFDVKGALDAGYAPAEVVQFLAGLGDNTMVQADRLPAAVGKSLKLHPGNLTGPDGLRVMAEIAAQVAASKGRFDLLDANVGTTPGTIPPELGGVRATSGRGPIRDPVRWQASREDVQRHVERLAALASTAGDHELAGRVLAIGAAPDADAKAAMAAAFLTNLPAERAALARQILADKTLLKGVSPTEGTS